MPAGCEFICQNVECLHYNSGFSMTGPWPLGKIEKIVANINPTLQKQIEYKEDLVRWKNEGRKLACLILPNAAKVPIEGYRVNMWDETAKCIWNYDVVLQDGETLEDGIVRSVPKESQEGNKLKDFSETVNDGVLCPHCGEKMKESRWFSNNE